MRNPQTLVNEILTAHTKTTEAQSENMAGKPKGPKVALEPDEGAKMSAQAEALGLDQIEIAAHVGLHSSTISRIFGGAIMAMAPEKHAKLRQVLRMPSPEPRGIDDFQRRWIKVLSLLRGQLSHEDIEKIIQQTEEWANELIALDGKAKEAFERRQEKLAGPRVIKPQ